MDPDSFGMGMRIQRQEDLYQVGLLFLKFIYSFRKQGGDNSVIALFLYLKDYKISWPFRGHKFYKTAIISS